MAGVTSINKESYDPPMEPIDITVVPVDCTEILIDWSQCNLEKKVLIKNLFHYLQGTLL
jgi:hypothetical protein